MKKFFNIFFVALGVIFLIVIIVVSYWYLTLTSKDKTMDFFSGSEVTDKSDDSTEIEAQETTVEGDKHPALSESQEKTLETFGIDPANLPSEISPEQEVCFEAILGKERVAEVKAGASPTVPEYFKAKDCL